jgi:hypothetical protein
LRGQHQRRLDSSHHNRLASSNPVQTSAPLSEANIFCRLWIHSTGYESSECTHHVAVQHRIREAGEIRLIGMPGCYHERSTIRFRAQREYSRVIGSKSSVVEYCIQREQHASPLWRTISLPKCWLANILEGKGIARLATGCAHRVLVRFTYAGRVQKAASHSTAITLPFVSK